VVEDRSLRISIGSSQPITTIGLAARAAEPDWFWNNWDSTGISKRKATFPFGLSVADIAQVDHLHVEVRALQGNGRAIAPIADSPIM
jgi:hypothetical protein